MKTRNERDLFYYFDEFSMDYSRRGRSEVTMKKVKDALNLAYNVMNITTIKQCNTSKLLKEALFKLKDERNWSPVTFNTYLKSINTYFIWLESNEYIQENKVCKIARCAEPINEQYTLSEAQISVLVAHMQNRPTKNRLEYYRNIFFINLYIETGARPCEISSLKLNSLTNNDGKAMIRLQGKKQKGRPRYYIFSTSLNHSLEVYLHHRKINDRYENNLFVSMSSKKGWTQRGMETLFKRLSRELGFRVNPYAIRRFVATKLYSAGLDAKKIMNHMGHTRLSTTLRYVEASGDLTKSGTDILSQFTNKPENN